METDAKASIYVGGYFQQNKWRTSRFITWRLPRKPYWKVRLEECDAAQHPTKALTFPCRISRSPARCSTDLNALEQKPSKVALQAVASSEITESKKVRNYLTPFLSTYDETRLRSCEASWIAQSMPAFQSLHTWIYRAWYPALTRSSVTNCEDQSIISTSSNTPQS